jgi:hypothetical protein
MSEATGGSEFAAGAGFTRLSKQEKKVCLRQEKYHFTW